MLNPRYDINDHIYKKERLTDIENRLVIVKGEEGRIGNLGLADENYCI